MSMHALSLILFAATSTAAPAPDPLASPASVPSDGGDLLAIKVGRAETVAHGVIEHAVILVENGKIVTIGEDLPIERGIPILERPEWTVMPGLVNPYTRTGMDSRAGEEFNPQISALSDLYPAHEDYDEILKYGVTTLGEYPPGRAVPGRAIAIRPQGETEEAMLLKKDAYLKIYYRSDARSKKMIRDAFAKVDDYQEKEKKAREKFDKDQEKKKPEEKKPEEKKPEEKKPEGKQEASAQDEKKEEKKDDKAAKVYVPPEPDEKVKPFLELRQGKLGALVSISQAGDYLHWIDAITKDDKEEKFTWDLRIPMTRELDIYEVKDKIGARKCRVVIEPEITMQPGTMRQRNLAAELATAGAKPVFLPRSDTLPAHKQWLRAVGELVAQGLARDVALRAVTLEPAGLLGVADRVGSLEKGKDANLLFLSGDPFESGTQVRAVMLEGRFVFGEVK
jgi:amidohydrolase family protein